MSTLLIKNGTIVNEGKVFKADLFIENDSISKISDEINCAADKVIDQTGLFPVSRDEVQQMQST